jgi:hypothetical protein
MGSIIGFRTFALTFVFTASPLVLTGDELPLELYSRTAKEERDMAYGMWAILQRQGATGLPRPDYSSSTAEIYRIFTLNLITTTQSLTPLLLAAVKNVTGPSWVPDWNTHESHEWGANVEEILKTNEFGVNRLQLPISTSSRKLSPIRGWFRFNENGTSIEVQGLHIGEVTLCFRFKRTREEYQEPEHGHHLDNLNLVKWVSRWFGRTYVHHPFYKWIFEDSIVLDLTRSLRNADKKMIRNWAKFHRRNDRKDLTQTLTRLRKDPTLFKYHIKISNFLAGKELLLVGKCPREPGRSIGGTCTHKVQVGDQIVRVKGVPQLLILRSDIDSPGSFRIISPAVLADEHPTVLSSFYTQHPPKCLPNEYRIYRIN